MLRILKYLHKRKMQQPDLHMPTVSRNDLRANVVFSDALEDRGRLNGEVKHPQTTNEKYQAVTFAPAVAAVTSSKDTRRPPPASVQSRRTSRPAARAAATNTASFASASATPSAARLRPPDADKTPLAGMRCSCART